MQNVSVTPDEAGMRVDRFFEARFPGLSFSHIQRVIRKGEVRVNGKRTEPKNRLEAGQTVRIPVCGHGLLDLTAYESFLAGQVTDFALPAQALQDALAGLPAGV